MASIQQGTRGGARVLTQLDIQRVNQYQEKTNGDQRQYHRKQGRAKQLGGAGYGGGETQPEGEQVSLVVW